MVSFLCKIANSVVSVAATLHVWIESLVFDKKRKIRKELNIETITHYLRIKNKNYKQTSQKCMRMYVMGVCAFRRVR